MLPPNTLLQNRYRIKRALAKGGMGVVYEAEAVHLGHTIVAVKQTSCYEDWLRKQFEREAALLAHLRHPALPKVTDHFSEGAEQFLVMEFIPGDDLEKLLEQRGAPFDWQQVVAWADRLLDALDYIHTQYPPVIHRDIKPSNLKLTPRGEILLLDFGLAKNATTPTRPGGSVRGHTLNYAPPEQIKGTGTDVRCDLYSLGATLYHLLTDQPPTDGKLRAEMMAVPMPDPLRPAHLVNLQIPLSLSVVIARAMAVERDRRYASAKAMRDDLQQALRSIAQTLIDQEHEKQEAERRRREKAEAERRQREEAERLQKDQAEAAHRQREEAERKQREMAERQRREALEQELAEERHQREDTERVRKEKEEAERRQRTDAKRRQRVLEQELAEERRLRAKAEYKQREEVEREHKEKEEADRKRNNLSSAPASRDRMWIMAGLLVGITSLALLSYVLWYSGSNSNGNQANNSPVPAPTKSSRSNSALSPNTFEFETVQLDRNGKKVARNKGQARFFAEDLGNGVTLEMVEIPGVTFQMGSSDGDSDEKPIHTVTVPAFWMGKYEVTQTQWQAVMDGNPSNFKGDGKLPVEKVSWNDAQKFLQKLNARSNLKGKDYRLPTEAEWEYAARAGTQTPFAFGETITPEIVNYHGNYPYANAPKGEYRQKTLPVGSLPFANAFGLFDMHGNVWEWCQDVWHDSYNGAPIDGSAWLSGGDPNRRVLRGGSWYVISRFCRSANRFNHAPGVIYNVIGLRVVSALKTP
jgi:formylglycine-generating enzyme required for sulfatase activity